MNKASGCVGKAARDHTRAGPSEQAEIFAEFHRQSFFHDEHEEDYAAYLN
jgi:hypothetical protein